MLDKLHVELKNKKGAFSVAEMLMVLLILSFLILALPPIAHKKVEKRVIRGEHGRYECWIDPNNGMTYEYYATEKNGVAPGYTATGKVVDSCRFSPKEQAPNAAYFSFQAIGGGAGGTYPPYDPNNTTYKDEDYAESATVRLSTSCCSSYSSSSSYGNCNYSESNDIYDYSIRVGSNIQRDEGCGNTTNYLSRYCYHYAGSIYYYSNLQSTSNWIKKYWVPVPGTGKIKICSGRGYTGVPDLGLIQFSDPDGSYRQLYRYHYGGKYGEGACWERDASSLYLDYDNRYKIVYSTRPDADKYFYGYNGNSSTQIITSWEFKPAGYDVAQYGPDWTTPSPQIDLPARYGNYQIPAAAGGNSACGVKYYGNYVKAFLDGGGFADTCTVGPGLNGAKADPNSEMANFEYQNSPLTKGGPSPTTCDAPWSKVADNITSMAVSISRPSWPSSITIRRQYGYDTPTMGYAGTPGQSVGMFLPKLMDDLTFEIGAAGAPGQPGSKTGGNGGNTVVRAGGHVILTAKGGIAKAGGELGNKVFMFGRDAMFGREAIDRVVTKEDGTTETIPGRPAVVAACSGLGLDPSGPGQIDGCLDKTVARDNPKRFAVDSEFYTILELDANSRTPSAIYRLYGAEGTGIMPGTAGDGGYSFLRSTSGRESLTYTNHPTAQDWVQDYEYEYTGPYTCYKRDDNFGNPTGEVVNNPDTVCKPTRGYPGAVVIVW